MEQIPKKIHYCWFGSTKKPEIVQTCIASWKRFMPGYEILEWNEQNYDIHKATFMEQAYEQKKWAFVSDYARFDILNTYGGIYFDTDVELLKAIPSEILNNEAFTGFESAGNVAPGLVYGTVPGHPLLHEFLSEYNSMSFVIDGNPVFKTVNMVTTQILERHTQGGIPDGCTKLNSNVFQVIDGLALYPPQYFCGFDQDIREYDIRPETISVHHYAGTWKNTTMKKRVQKLAKTLFGKNAYRKLLMVKRRFFGTQGK